MVPRPRLRQLRSDLRTPDPRSRASARGRLEGDLRRPRDTLRRALEQREARAQRGAAPSHDDGRHHASRPRSQVCRSLPTPRRRGAGFDPRAGAPADGAEPREGTVGARHQLLGGGAGALDQPHADHERRELSGAGRELWPARPVPPSLLEVIARRGDGSGIRQGNPPLLLDACEHGLRRDDPGRWQPGHHVRLRSAHHPLRYGPGRSGHDQRPDLCRPGGHRRAESDPRAQAECAAPQEFTGRAARSARRDDRVPARAPRSCSISTSARWPACCARQRRPAASISSTPRTCTTTRRWAVSRTPWWATTARVRSTTT